LIKQLSDNYEQNRTKAMKQIKKDLEKQTIASENYKKLWQGIFYCLWHSDTYTKQLA